jgi:hypothetical protein
MNIKLPLQQKWSPPAAMFFYNLAVIICNKLNAAISVAML